MAVFVSVLALVYSIIFHWSPWSALYFVTMTTFANGNIGDLVPEVIFYHSLATHTDNVPKNTDENHKASKGAFTNYVSI